MSALDIADIVADRVLAGLTRSIGSASPPGIQDDQPKPLAEAGQLTEVPPRKPRAAAMTDERRTGTDDPEGDRAATTGLEASHGAIMAELPGACGTMARLAARSDTHLAGRWSREGEASPLGRLFTPTLRRRALAHDSTACIAGLRRSRARPPSVVAWEHLLGRFTDLFTRPSAALFTILIEAWVLRALAEAA